MAPIVSDNKMLLAKFVSMAIDFSSDAKVDVTDSSFNRCEKVSKLIALYNPWSALPSSGV